MIKKLNLLIISVLALSVFALPAFASAQDQIRGGLCQGAKNLKFGAADNTAGCDATANEGGLNALITKIVNIISVLVAIIAVIMIIVGGFKYIASGGDSSKVTGAKNTILYAIIGLIVVALAQFIVKFVLNQSSNVAP